MTERKGTRDENTGHRSMARKVILLAIGFAALFWILESLVHVLVFRDGTLIEQILAPASHQIWMRSVGAFIIIVFGVYAQFAITERKRLRENMQFYISEITRAQAESS